MVIVDLQEGKETIDAEGFQLDSAGNLVLLQTVKVATPGAQPGQVRIVHAYASGVWKSASIAENIVRMDR